MNEYQQGFTHACRLIKTKFKEKKITIPKDLQKLFNFVDESELAAIEKGIGV